MYWRPCRSVIAVLSPPPLPPWRSLTRLALNNLRSIHDGYRAEIPWKGFKTTNDRLIRNVLLIL